MTMFQAGEAIVHPVRGAGVVVCIEERQWCGSSKLYYRIKLLGQPTSSLIIPIIVAETIGMRRAIPPSKLNQVWHMLQADPTTLPADRNERYQLLKDKLHAGDVLQVAEAVRDMAWRQQRRPGLTARGKQIYQEGLMLLAGEIAATQGIDLADAEVQIKAKLRESLSPTDVT